MAEGQVEDQARLLVALQDLDHMIKEASDAKTSEELKSMGFNIDGVAELEEARKNLAARPSLSRLALCDRFSPGPRPQFSRRC